MTWFEAAQYCRWLSEQDGISEDQMCYPPVAQIGPGMKLPPNYLSRTGYRLPTEAEWEYTCRAGAITSRAYGSTDKLLGKYAWYHSNAKEQTSPVGRLMPNDLGMFDMYGNASEWCQDRLLPYPALTRERVIEDREDSLLVVGDQPRVLRGGSIASPATELRSAFRTGLAPNSRGNYVGFRIARTLS